MNNTITIMGQALSQIGGGGYTYEQTTAYKCRYGAEMAPLFEGASILWEDSEDDYQGHVEVLALRDQTLLYLEYSYGSCSGCDSWEDEADRNPNFDILTAGKRCLMTMGLQAFEEWVRMLRQTKDKKADVFAGLMSAALRGQTPS